MISSVSPNAASNQERLIHPKIPNRPYRSAILARRLPSHNEYGPSLQAGFERAAEQRGINSQFYVFKTPDVAPISRSGTATATATATDPNDSSGCNWVSLPL